MLIQINVHLNQCVSQLSQVFCEIHLTGDVMMKKGDAADGPETPAVENHWLKGPTADH